jgi:hypothetical protein
MMSICVERSVGTRLLAIQWGPWLRKGLFLSWGKETETGRNTAEVEEEVGGWEKG